jgi:predicted ABC-type ATPase
MNRIITALRKMGAIPASNERQAGPIRWQAVFFIGPAASGKSFVKTKRYLRHLDFKEVDPDEIKKTHPDYDPERPFDLHAWSKELADAQYKRILNDGSGSPVIVDGTGRNWKGIEKKMREAEKNGYRTYVVYVFVPFEVSIFRNRNRERFVPEEVIMEQSRQIANSFKKLKSIADKSKVVPNFSSSEISKAKKDIEVYPVPQDVRPPRPGDSDYGKLEMAIAASLVKIAKKLIGDWG